MGSCPHPRLSKAHAVRRRAQAKDYGRKHLSGGTGCWTGPWPAQRPAQDRRGRWPAETHAARQRRRRRAIQPHERPFWIHSDTHRGETGSHVRMEGDSQCFGQIVFLASIHIHDSIRHDYFAGSRVQKGHGWYVCDGRHELRCTGVRNGWYEL